MLAGGVFLVPAMVADTAGPLALVALVVAAVLAYSVARFCVAPEAPAGGFGHFIGSWLGVSARIAAAAALAGIFAAYLLPHVGGTAHATANLITGSALPAAQSVSAHIAHGAAAAIAVLVATLIVLAGYRPSPSVVSLATGAAVVGLGFYCGLSAPMIARTSFVPFAPHGWTALPGAVALMFFLFGGTEYVKCLSPVLAKAHRAVPNGAVLGVVMTAVAVFIVAFVSIGVGGPAFTLHRLFSPDENHAPLLAVAVAAGQPAALWGLSIAAVVSCAVAIHRLISEASETVGSMARMAEVPVRLGAVLPLRDAPLAAIPVGLLLLVVAIRAPLAGLIAFASGSLLLSLTMRLLASRSAGRPSKPLRAAGLACLLLAACLPWPALMWLSVVFLLGVAMWYLRDLWKTRA